MRLLAALLSLAWAAAPAAAEPPLLALEQFTMRLGGAEAAVPVTLAEIPPSAHALTLEAEVVVPPGLRRPGQPLGLYLGALASHEVWWDGVLLGRGGVVGRTAAEEVPGPIEAQYQIPDALAGPGRHRLTIHTSAFHRRFQPSSGFWGVWVGDYETLSLRRRAAATGAAAALGGLLLTTGFAGALFAATRERASLQLSLLALSAAALLAVEVWRPLFGYAYDVHIVRLWAILVLSALVAGQLLALLAVRFPVRRGRWWLGLVALTAAGIAVGVPSWDGKVLGIHALGLVVALAWTAHAMARGLPGSGLTLLGLLAAAAVLIAAPSDFSDRLFWALNLLFLCWLAAHALEVRRTRQARAAAELEATRLQLEMVRRHIQPHSLMNTLTALCEWVETEPRTAVRMIEAIAEELRLLGELAEARLVRAREELRLCRSHLAILSLRKDVRYELTVDGLTGEELLPPAVLHTLVENAVTHGPTLPEVRLRLHAEVVGRRRRLVLESPTTSVGVPERVGTGTRYVEARLRQAWGEDWSFRQGPVAGVWRVELDLPLEAPA